MQKSATFEKLQNKYLKERNIKKLYIIFIMQMNMCAHSIRNLKYGVPKKNHIVFRNGSNYDCHFIIKEIAEEFKKQYS